MLRFLLFKLLLYLLRKHEYLVLVLICRIRPRVCLTSLSSKGQNIPILWLQNDKSIGLCIIKRTQTTQGMIVVLPLQCIHQGRTLGPGSFRSRETHLWKRERKLGAALGKAAGSLDILLSIREKILGFWCCLFIWIRCNLKGNKTCTTEGTI